MNAKTIVLWALGLLALSGCVTQNAFHDSYRSSAQESVTNLPAWSGHTDVLTLSDRTSDVKMATRRGYVPLGESSFQTERVVTPSMLLAQAKTVGADLVLWSSSDVGNHRYQNDALFFRKRNPPILGTIGVPLTDALRAKLHRNSGMLVTAVMDDSPASRAKLLEGDVLLKIADQEIVSPSDLTQKLKQLAGQTVRLEFWRADQTRTISVQLNAAERIPSKELRQGST